jgi:hypothetical protein
MDLHFSFWFFNFGFVLLRHIMGKNGEFTISSLYFSLGKFKYSWEWYLPRIRDKHFKRRPRFHCRIGYGWSGTGKTLVYSFEEGRPINDSSFSYQIAMWQGINILGKNFLLYKAYGKNKKET